MYTFSELRPSEYTVHRYYLRGLTREDPFFSQLVVCTHSTEIPRQAHHACPMQMEASGQDVVR